jgi:glycolate oxidase
LDVFISATEERQEIIWKARGAFLEAIKSSTSQLGECDVVVPRDRMADFISFIHLLEKEHGAKLMSFGHAGDGNVHVYVLRDKLEEAAWKKLHSEIMQKLYSKAGELRGQVSGEHGIGYDKQHELCGSLGTKALGIMRGIKDAFDPCGILNPGKVVCGGNSDEKELGHW